MTGIRTAGAQQPKSPGATVCRASIVAHPRFGIVAIAAACLSGMLPGAAHACSVTLEGGKTIDSARHSIVYRTDPASIAVGKPFAVDLVVCPKEAAATIDELRVDAHMPEHRHGMNYKASVKPQGTVGRYRAEGLMFHMPGKWEFLFDIRDAKGVERLQQIHPLK